MSVRVREPIATPSRLQHVLAAGAGVALQAPPPPRRWLSGAEFTVMDSSGAQFGTAVQTNRGACFVEPVELNGVPVCLPFRLAAGADSAGLARSLAATLSSALAE